MSPKKWWLLLGAVMAGGGMTVVLGLISLFVIPWLRVDHSLPIYTSQQTASTHPGHWHTTLTCGNLVYVNDSEEASLQLIQRDPTTAVGRQAFGDGKICAIAGQKTTAYLAVDVGSEMSAYAVFRNIQQPPFDWRHAAFQRMDLSVTTGPAARRKSTTDPALIADAVRTLSEGTPVPPPSLTTSNIFGIELFSDQLPGLFFTPSVGLDETGAVYLTESLAIEIIQREPKIHARWIHASPQVTHWVQTP